MAEEPIRVALALYGQPRFLDNPEVPASIHENLINQYETDVFCHTWYSPEADYQLPSWSPISDNFISEHPVQEISKLYSPLYFEVDSPRDFSFKGQMREFLDRKFTGQHPSWNARNYSNVLSQLHSISTVSNMVHEHMVQSGCHYDFIALCRYDAILVGIPDLSKLSTRRLYLPHNHGRFPDMVLIFGTSFLNWARNLANDSQSTDIAPFLFSPGPEGFKYATYRNRHSLRQLAPIAMNAHAVRFSGDSISNALFSKELRSLKTKIRALSYYREK